VSGGLGARFAIDCRNLALAIKSKNYPRAKLAIQLMAMTLSTVSGFFFVPIISLFFMYLLSQWIDLISIDFVYGGSLLVGSMGIAFAIFYFFISKPVAKFFQQILIYLFLRKLPRS
jgi:hypothetical protein